MVGGVAVAALTVSAVLALTRSIPEVAVAGGLPVEESVTV